MSEPYKDPEVLDRLYNDWGLSQRGVAEFLGCSQGVISTYMRRHDVDRAKSNLEKPPNHYFDRRGSKLATYSVIQHYDGEKRQKVLIHRLLAVAIDELDTSEFAGSDKEVHHKSGHGLDNRHDNITVMTRSEHQKETIRRLNASSQTDKQ